jgi:hypothetical protein
MCAVQRMGFERKTQVADIADTSSREHEAPAAAG